jgi:hypothetical protein
VILDDVQRAPVRNWLIGPSDNFLYLVNAPDDQCPSSIVSVIDIYPSSSPLSSASSTVTRSGSYHLKFGHLILVNASKMEHASPL